MPVLLGSLDELSERVLKKAKNAVRKVKVTKAPDYSKVKVLTNRRMYVVIVKTEELESTLERIKQELGVEELNTEIYEVKKPIKEKA